MENVEQTPLVKLPTTMVVTVDTGGVKVLKDGKSGPFEIAGWASTDDMDLEGHVVLPTAFQKHFAEYEQKGRYWYNHNRDHVIGKVEKAHITDNGFYIDKAILSDTEFNRSYLIPLLKDGALNEHSIRFFSVDNEYNRKSGVLYHKEVRIVETSIVSFACNPSAIIENFKSYVPSEEYENCTLEDLYELESKGMLKYPSEMKKQFFMNEFKTLYNKSEEVSSDSFDNTEEPVEEIMPDQETTTNAPVDFREFSPTDTISMSKEEHTDRLTLETLPLPSKKSKKYAEIVEPLFLAKSLIKEGRFILPVASLTKNGPVYDWNKTALALGSLLGLKGGYLLADDTKVELFEKVFDIYNLLEKALPTFEDTPLNELTADALVNLKFHEVEFLNDEQEVCEENLLDSNLSSVTSLFGKYKESETAPQFATDLFKKYLGFDFAIHATVDRWTSEDEQKVLFTVIDMLNLYFESKREEKDAEELLTAVKSALLPEELAEETSSTEESVEEVNEEVVENSEEETQTLGDLEVFTQLLVELEN